MRLCRGIPSRRRARSCLARDTGPLPQVADPVFSDASWSSSIAGHRDSVAVASRLARTRVLVSLAVVITPDTLLVCVHKAQGGYPTSSARNRPLQTLLRPSAFLQTPRSTCSQTRLSPSLCSPSARHPLVHGSALAPVSWLAPPSTPARTSTPRLTLLVVTLSISVSSTRSPGCTCDPFVQTVGACVCLSNLQAFIDANSGAQELLDDLDGDNQLVDSILTAIIGQQGEQCTYPDNSVPACTSDDVCAFTCTNGFTASPANAPDSCVCESPNTVCNGVCGSQACPSGVSNGRRSDYGASLRRRAIHSCPRTHIACGAYERRGAHSLPFDCVDAQNDLESCGGCLVPLDKFSPVGVDCSAIAGAVDVACTSGSCVVSRCSDGFTLGSGNTTCVSTGLLNQV
ncbi:hypothetical protein C8Q80DRAFT_1151189 [Daedaleopsis nitida]|nr:hypothetical protein C8Q80DRAFT_1151189 [Daedaleopsis nitida]